MANNAYESYAKIKDYIRDLFKSSKGSYVDTEKILKLGIPNSQLENEMMDKLGNATADDAVKLLIKQNKEMNKRMDDITEILILNQSAQVNTDIELKKNVLEGFTLILDENMRNSSQSPSSESSSEPVVCPVLPEPTNEKKDMLDKIGDLLDKEHLWKLAAIVAVVAVGLMVLAYFDKEALGALVSIFKQ